MTSIRHRLLLGLLGATLLCVLGAGASLYFSLLEETNEVGDLQLRQLAVAVPNEFAPDTAVASPQDPEEAYVLQSWDSKGALVYAAPGKPHLPNYLLDGYTRVKVDGKRWRLYGVTRRGRYVQVAQTMTVRRQLAASMAWRAGSPLLIFAVLLALMMVAVVARALKPLDRLADSVAGRSPDALTPLQTAEMPPELRPVVLALNGLMQKFDEAITAQRTFVADAAHELRSPLTALKLQLQVAERATSDAARSAALKKLHDRLDRSTHLVRQLLSLARHEAALAPSKLQTVDLGELLAGAVADHGALADSREIDLGVVAPLEVMVEGDPDGLQVLLNNLVDNALRYTQAGGTVDLQAASVDGRAMLRVRDNGPGVPELHRARLFDRFYRPDGNDAWGCGLGLSIVRNIADHHRAEIELAESGEGRGLCVTVWFGQPGHQLQTMSPGG